jgi:sodium transport system permease protein
MNRTVLWLLYVHELKMLLRARRTVVMAIVIPAVIMPVMIYAQKFTVERRERALSATTYRYAVTGPLADRVRRLIEKTRHRVAESTGDEFDDLREFKFSEIRLANPRYNLDNDTIQFYIQTMGGKEADKLPRTSDGAPSRPAASAVPQPKRLHGVPRITVIFRGDRDTSDSAHDRMMDLLRLARDEDSRLLLVDRGFAGDPKGLFAVEDSNIATNGQVTGSLVGRFITVFLVMMMFTGGAVASMDIIAGEKERGTLETLLTTAVRRTEIVTAKLMSITCVALVITLIQGVNFFLYIRLKVIALPKDFDLQLPTGMVLTLLAMFVPLAATIAAVLLMISAYAKSYKEAQMYFFPVYLVSMIPALASVVPGLSLRSAIALVPLANVSVASREILMGRPDALMITVTFVVMALFAAFLMRTSARMLAREDLIIPSHSEPAEFLGGPVLFQKRVLRWFALMWAVTFAVAANIPQLATFQRQLLFNEVVIMIGATLLMLRLYNLDVRDALSLRRVKPVIWLAILFAIPSGYLTALAIFRIVNVVIPAPQQLLERFSEDFIPAGMPMWQLYIYIALLPAVCEEIAFRGMLLNGLRRRMRPTALIVSVGIVFGLFHMTLFRIAPTALLGMILTGIALMTGSIFPGMLMHAGNNAFGLWAGTGSLGLESLGWQYYAAAGMIFALSLWIIYRNRTPLPTRPVYPGI